MQLISRTPIQTIRVLVIKSLSILVIREWNSFFKMTPKFLLNYHSLIVIYTCCKSFFCRFLFINKLIQFLVIQLC